MRSKDPQTQVRQLSVSIGDFIRYWGFRRIHGAIWTQLYLSTKPMSCTDLTRKLGLSKALISPALEELIQHQLLKYAPSPNDKSKLYVANEDFNSVIKNVLQTRELKILERISENYESLDHENYRALEISETRMRSLGEMIFSANVMLQFLLNQENLVEVPKEIGTSDCLK